MAIAGIITSVAGMVITIAMIVMLLFPVELFNRGTMKTDGYYDAVNVNSGQYVAFTER